MKITNRAIRNSTRRLQRLGKIMTKVAIFQFSNLEFKQFQLLCAQRVRMDISDMFNVDFLEILANSHLKIAHFTVEHGVDVHGQDVTDDLILVEEGFLTIHTILISLASVNFQMELQSFFSTEFLLANVARYMDSILTVLVSLQMFFV